LHDCLGSATIHLDENQLVDVPSTNFAGNGRSTAQIAGGGKRDRRAVPGGNIQTMQRIRQAQNSFFDGLFVNRRESDLNSLWQVAGVAVSAEWHDIDPSLCAR
jgi:hypothetical protein